MLTRLSIRVLAPALLVLPVLLVAGVLIAIGTVQGRAAVHRLASQQLGQIHDQIGERVEGLVSLPARANRVNIALLKEGRLDPEALRPWGPVLVEQFRAFEHLSAITWGDERGRCTWVARYDAADDHLFYAVLDGQAGSEIVEYRVSAEGRIGAEPEHSFAFDPRERPWYVAPKEAGGPAWSEPFVWVGGGEGGGRATLGIAYGWPLYDETGGLIGVMDADLSLQDLSRYLSQLRIGRSGRAFMVDGEGLLLASSGQAPVTDDDGGRRAALACEEAWISSAARHLQETFGDVAAVSRVHERILEVEGTREWLRASRFAHETGLEWVIVTVVPEADFTAEIAAGRRRSGWVTAGVTVGTLGLGMVLAGFLVRPILALSGHVRRLGDGDLEGTIRLAGAREFARLSDDINQMAADLRDRMMLRRSLEMAMDVQQSLLPSATPAVAGLEIHGHSTYCDETGGDYYDYLEIADLSDHAAALVVGDVMGHGIAAAMLMATARGILRSRATVSGSLGELLAHLNELLVEVTGGTRFMTMVLVVMDGRRGTLRLSSAGHDPPFIYDPVKDAFIELHEGGLPLGIMSGAAYPEAESDVLSVGTVVLSSTDGVWEAQNGEAEQFGKARVREFLRSHAHLSAREIADGLVEAVETFCGEAKQLDDITFVVAKRVAV